MILHIAPDYMNKPLYAHLIEGLRTQDRSLEHYVFACDNAIHNTQNIPVNVHIVNRSFSILERLLFFPKQHYLLHEIESNIPIKDIDLIHAHTLFSSGYLAYLLYKKYQIPYIVAIRNTDVNVFFKYMPHLRHIGREIAAHAQKIIFISSAYQNQVIGKFFPDKCIEKSIVIPNGIDSLFLKQIANHKQSLETIRLIYAGRLEKDKNIHTIIKVADYLIMLGQKVSLCLVGKIEDHEYVSMINQRSYIEWHDHCSQAELIQYFRQNDIFIMPSYHETFGLVYAESMSQGLPVIYTKGQGFDGFFNDGEVGYAVPTEDIQYIANKIMDIHTDYANISHNCIEKAQQFDWQSLAKTYHKIYISTHK